MFVGVEILAIQMEVGCDIFVSINLRKELGLIHVKLRSSIFA